MRQEKTLLVAEFDPKLVRYWMLGAQLSLLVLVVTIPIMFVWIFVGWGFHRKQFDRMSATLTDRSLNIRRGLIFRVEKNVPLDRIQDLTMMEGPLLRWLGLSRLHIETAGQNVGGGGGAHLVGVIDAPAFRDAVLDQRDRINDASHGAQPAATAGAGEGLAASGPGSDVLVAIRDSLGRIEGHLETLVERDRA